MRLEHTIVADGRQQKLSSRTNPKSAANGARVADKSNCKAGRRGFRHALGRKQHRPCLAQQITRQLSSGSPVGRVGRGTDSEQGSLRGNHPTRRRFPSGSGRSSEERVEHPTASFPTCGIPWRFGSSPAGSPQPQKAVRCPPCRLGRAWTRRRKAR